MAKKPNLTKSVGQRTDIKYDRNGKRIGGGTLITQAIYDSAVADMENIEVIADNTAEIIQAIGEAIGRALEAVGLEAEGDAKELCPVDTGRLRNSITHTIDADDKVAIIGTNVEYASYVHNGTSRSKAQPFLTDAVNQNADKYRDIFDKYFKGN